MGRKRSLDKRLLEQRVSAGELREQEFRQIGESAADLSSEIARPDEAEIQAFRESLERESRLRAERIERQLNEPSQPVASVAPTIIPLAPGSESVE